MFDMIDINHPTHKNNNISHEKEYLLIAWLWGGVLLTNNNIMYCTIIILHHQIKCIHQKCIMVASRN